MPAASALSKKPVPLSSLSEASLSAESSPARALDPRHERPYLVGSSDENITAARGLFGWKENREGGRRGGDEGGGGEDEGGEEEELGGETPIDFSEASLRLLMAAIAPRTPTTPS